MLPVLDSLVSTRQVQQKAPRLIRVLDYCVDRLRNHGISLENRQLGETVVSRELKIVCYYIQQSHSLWCMVWGQKAMSTSWNEDFRHYTRESVFYPKVSQAVKQDAQSLCSHSHWRFTKPSWMKIKETWCDITDLALSKHLHLCNLSCLPTWIILSFWKFLFDFYRKTLL